jgi:hypothetical protein
MKLWQILLTLLMFSASDANVHGEAAQPTTTTAPATAPAAPAGTPGEAMIRVFEAQANGDEAALRRAAVFRPPDGIAARQARAMLASARLHRAVNEHGVTAQRTRDAGFDRGQNLLANEPLSGQRLEQARLAIKQMEWDVQGDTARPVRGGPLGGDGGQEGPVAQRAGDGWVIVFTDPPDADDAADQLARAATIHADVFTAAAEQVEAGKLRTIREVNDFIEARRNAVHERAVAELRAAEPKGPVVVVMDVETDKPVVGAQVSARILLPPARFKTFTVTTDPDGRARLPAEPDGAHEVSAEAPGYALRAARRSSVRGQGGAPDEIHLKIGKPIVVEVELVLPDDRRAAFSVYEGHGNDPAPPGLRERLEPKRISIPFVWEDEPPPLPDHHPMLILHLPSASPHHKVEGVVHRVTRARTAGGRELTVFRDAPPKDEDTFGLYDVGVDGMENTVFVVGTLADARAVKAPSPQQQGVRNDRILGPATPGRMSER